MRIQINTSAILLVATLWIVAACATEATPTHPDGPLTLMFQWDKPPPMSIDKTKSYTAVLKTEKGDITLDLFGKDATHTVNNFVFLARNGYYDNTTFHRVLAGFIAQGGDPTGTGAGGPGYTIDDEINRNTHEGGMLSMAKGQSPNSGGSQFFVTFKPQHHLDNAHTVFGRVTDGMDVLEKLTLRDPNTNPSFSGDILFTVEIIEK